MKISAASHQQLFATYLIQCEAEDAFSELAEAEAKPSGPLAILNLVKFD